MVKEKKEKKDMYASKNKEALIKFNKLKMFFLKIKDNYIKWDGIGKILTFFIIFLVILSIVLSSFYLNRSDELSPEEYKINMYQKIKLDLNDIKSNGEITFDILKWLATILIDFYMIKEIFYNCILVAAGICFIYCIVGNIKASLIVNLIVWTLFNIINYIVLDLRGAAFAISDIFSIGTALTVVSGMKLNINDRFVIYNIVFIVLLIFLIFIKFKKVMLIEKKDKIFNIVKRVIALDISIILLFSIINLDGFKTSSYWNLNQKYAEKGFQYMILRQIMNLSIEEPEGYSVEKAKEILSRYDKQVNDAENKDIIIIVNEAFSDINKVYELGFENNIPFISSLEENTIKGTVYSSVLGGQTAMSEWEFLTGNSSAFVPIRAIPFSTYIETNKHSLIRNLNSEGYMTFSLHGYYETGYNRAVAYPRLGFQKSVFSETFSDYIQTEKSPTYVTDKYVYSKLIKEYENRDKSKSFLGYVLTMQNHVPYTAHEKGFELDGYAKDLELDEYLTLIKDTDDALKELIEYFSNVDKDVVLLFFGDHQPRLDFSYDMKKNENKWLLEQQIPYLLWANYDIEESVGEDISTNFLSTLIYKYSNIDTDQYIEFLKEFKKVIPVFTLEGYRDKDGKTYEIDDKSSPYLDLINEYNILQYYFMFDHEIEEN